MTKKEKIDFENLPPLFAEDREIDTFTEEEILTAIQDEKLIEVPEEKRAAFWKTVYEKMTKSEEFRQNVLEALQRVGQR